MITWNNLDTLTSYQELEKAARVNLAEVMTGEKGAERVKKYRGTCLPLCSKAGR